MELSQPLFLVGYSLGGSVACKYLGEEGLSGTLQKNVRGGFCISTPMKLQFDTNASWKLFEETIKGQLVQHRYEYSQMRCELYQSALENALRPHSKIRDIYSHMAPHLIRNDPQLPYSTSVGYKDVDHLFNEGSCYHYIKHITIPLLLITSKDDPTTSDHSLDTIRQSVSNPHVIVVETETGGHVGWNHVTGNNPFGSLSKSFADKTAETFFESLILLESTGRLTGDGALIDVVYSQGLDLPRIRSKL